MEENNNMPDNESVSNQEKTGNMENDKYSGNDADNNDGKKNKFGIEKNINAMYNDNVDNKSESNNDFSGKFSRSATIYAAIAVLAALLALIIIIDQSRLRAYSDTFADSSEYITEQTSAEQYSQYFDEDENDQNVSGSSVSLLKYTDVSKMTNDEIAENFYDETVFVGDYLTAGLEDYSLSDNAEDFLTDIIYLTADNMTTLNAVGDSPVNVVYKNKKTDVCTAVSKIKPLRIFINLGSNELTDEESVDETIYNYCQLVYKIKTASPSSKIYVISVPPVTKAREKTGYSNDAIQQYNEKMSEFSSAWGASYVDLADTLKNGKGYLPDSYSYDGIHMTETVYSGWAKYLKTYSSEHINDGLKP